MGYHKVDVFGLLKEKQDEQPDPVTRLLELPLLEDPSALTADEIERELENNCQGILGYVVRWIDQGVGCSKVPGITNEAQVQSVLERMAAVVDEQNAGDPNYQNMAPNFDKSFAFKAAKALIFEGKEQPSGYTEPLLHHYRQLAKQS